MKFSLSFGYAILLWCKPFPSFAIARKHHLCSMVMRNIIMDSGHIRRESTHLLLCLSVLVAAAPEMALAECIRYSVINRGSIGTATSG
jgi:hypothetical protein